MNQKDVVASPGLWPAQAAIGLDEVLYHMEISSVKGSCTIFLPSLPQIVSYERKFSYLWQASN